MMINCLEATRLSSLAQEKKLPFKDKLALSFHLFLCIKCRRFEKQINMIHKTLNRTTLDCWNTLDTPGLSEDCKNRIKEELKKK